MTTAENPTTISDIFKHPKGNFERLNTTNYPSWKNNMRRLLMSMNSWNIVAGTEVKPRIPEPLPDGDDAPDDYNYDHEVDLATKAQQKFQVRVDEAQGAIYNSCSRPIRIYIDDCFEPIQMWKVLAERVNTANNSVGRQALYRAFTALRPIPGFSVGDYFSRLLEIRNQLIGTPEAISDMMLRTHIFGTLPDNFAVTIKVLQVQPALTIEQIIDTLKQQESYDTLKPPTPAVTDAYYSNASRTDKWCTFCKRPSHNTEDCFSKPKIGRKRRRSPSPTNSNDNPCWHCASTGHQWDTCPIRLKAKEVKTRTLKKRRTENFQANSIQALPASDGRDAGPGC